MLAQPHLTGAADVAEAAREAPRDLAHYLLQRWQPLALHAQRR